MLEAEIAKTFLAARRSQIKPDKPIICCIGVLMAFAGCTGWVSGNLATYIVEAGLFSLTCLHISFQLITIVKSAVAKPAPAKSIKAKFLFLCALPFCRGLLQICSHSTEYQFHTRESCLFWLALFSMAYLGSSLYREPSNRPLFMNSLIGVALAITALEIVQLFALQQAPSQMFGLAVLDIPSPFLSSNSYAETIELILPICLTRALVHRQNWLINSCVAAFLIAMTVAAGARAGSMLLISETILIFIVVLTRRLVSRQRGVQVGAAMLVLLSALVLVVNPLKLTHRLQEKDPLRRRGEILVSTLEMVRNRPLTGFGLGTFADVYPSYEHFENSYFINHAHNDWCELAAEGGILLACCVGLIVATAFGQALRSVWGVGVIAVALHSCFDYPLYRISCAGTLFLLCGLLNGRGTEHKVNTSLTDRRNAAAISQR